MTERQCIQQEWDFLPSNAEIILDREDLTEWAVPELYDIIDNQKRCKRLMFSQEVLADDPEAT